MSFIFLMLFFIIIIISMIVNKDGSQEGGFLKNLFREKKEGGIPVVDLFINMMIIVFIAQIVIGIVVIVIMLGL